MITDDKMARKLFALWICSLRRDNDPDFDLKKQTIIDIMNELGVEEMDLFEKELEDTWKRQFVPHLGVNWKI